MTTQEFIFGLPLYTKVSISGNHILEDIHRNIQIEGYNSIRDAESTFYLNNHPDSSYIYSRGVYELVFVCKRFNDNFYVLVCWDRENDYIEKVGQYPSVADIHISQVKKYKKVLGESYIRDFTKAIGLAANGIGTGSFVYLRRIFEHLISEIAEEAVAAGKLDKTQFETSKMDNKIKLLSDYLPEVIIENKSLYGVLSVGIHELSEEDCLTCFPIVRAVIELILDERENNRLIKEKKKLVRDKLSMIAGEVKKAGKE